MVKRSDNANGLLPTIVIEGNARFQIEVNKNKNVPLTGRPRWRTAWVRVTRRAGEAQETSSAEAKAVCGAGAEKAGGRDSVTEEPLTLLTSRDFLLRHREATRRVRTWENQT